MDFSSIIPSAQVQRPTPVVTPSVQAAIVPVATSQQAMGLTRTQTVQAPPATGRSDGSRSTQSGTQGGQSLDTQANALMASANGGASRRGSTLDVSV